MLSNIDIHDAFHTRDGLDSWEAIRFLALMVCIEALPNGIGIRDGGFIFAWLDLGGWL